MYQDTVAAEFFFNMSIKIHLTTKWSLLSFVVLKWLINREESFWEKIVFIIGLQKYLQIYMHMYAEQE